MDVSHYNMLLKVNLENDHEFSPTEFLAWMDGKGVTPNRVTYGYMIARFCRTGDMSSASSILEHMKASEMPLNEAVFHALVAGHATAGDLAAARDTRRVMQEQGLDVHAATHVAHMAGMIRGGRATWEEVRDEFRAATGTGDINFDDRSILKLMLELVRADQLEGAKELAKELQKPEARRRDQLMCVLPQLVFEGGVEIAVQLYDEVFLEHKNNRSRHVGKVVWGQREAIRVDREFATSTSSLITFDLHDMTSEPRGVGWLGDIVFGLVDLVLDSTIPPFCSFGVTLTQPCKIIITYFSTEEEATEYTDGGRTRPRGGRGKLLMQSLAAVEHPPEEVVALIKKYVQTRIQ